MTINKSNKLVVLYASQTGNAEWIAKSINQEAVQRGFKSECYVTDDYEQADLEHTKVLIVVAANTGDGDPPENAIKFFRYLRKIKSKTFLSHCQFAILGLGDTNYTNFNNTAKRIEKKFLELGGRPFYDKGLADDASGLETVVEPWISNLWVALEKVCERTSTATTQTISTNDFSMKAMPTKNKDTNTTKETTIENVVANNNASTPTDDTNATRMNHAVSSTTATTVTTSTSATATTLIIKETTLNEETANNLTIMSTDDTSSVTTFTAALSITTPKLFSLGTPLTIDLSTLSTITQLTAIPRIPSSICRTTFHSTCKHTSKFLPPSFISTPSPIFQAYLSAATLLTDPDAVKRTLQIELEVDEEEKDTVTFLPGDAFGVIAPNDDGLVRGLLNRLGIGEDEMHKEVEIQSIDVAKHGDLPSHLKEAKSTSLYELLRYGLDLTSLIRKPLLRMLAECAVDAEEKKTLLFLCSKQGLGQFTALRNQLPTVLDVLATFPSCQPPFDRLLDVLLPLQPRYYSAINSLLAHPRSMHFAFNVVEFTNEFDVSKRGVCTPWLDELSGKVTERGVRVEINKDERVAIPLFLKPNTHEFNVPSDLKRNIIMIGPGTGVAPFLGFLQHRECQLKILYETMESIANVNRKDIGDIDHNGVDTNGTDHGDIEHKKTQSISSSYGESWLFYGCRDKSKDFLYKNEIEGYLSRGILGRLSVAVSREPGAGENGKPKYVQDLIKIHAKEVYEMIYDKDAVVFVCGDAKGMAKAVNDTLAAILSEYNGISHADALKQLLKWTDEKKYLLDLW
ncbi:10514_t:CDS:2 [Paraglomus occultum]|uniref:Methionine synthase reductase n=1 Tax=Paraglomus occultum TaxID=144539 RepID=A0A9N8WAM4_9GLOM|nr:10514_t:CDS:2 [Paraglomus occultum]